MSSDARSSDTRTSGTQSSNATPSAIDPFLNRLLLTPSPSGFESKIQEEVRQFAAPFADEARGDSHGNYFAGLIQNTRPRVMLAGHCDQIGLLVSYIDEFGFVYAQTIGGWDPQQLVGQHMRIWTEAGAIPAVIARKPIHLLTDAERRQVVKLEELWLDIGARDRSEAEQRVSIGDPITFELGPRTLQNDLLAAPGLDDKVGVWVVFEALRQLSQQRPQVDVYAVSTVQEEIGLRGARTSAFELAPDVGIAVDVTHATDCPTIDPKQRGDVKLGAGPVIVRGPNANHQVTGRLIELAKEHGIAYQLAALGRAAPNDANALQINRSGVATGLVAIPNRYMHSSVETVSMKDLTAAAELIAHYCRSLSPDDSFVVNR